MAALEYLINEKNATAIVSDNCLVAGNAAQLILLFQNLLASAIKFTGSGIKPVVTVHVASLNQNQAGSLKLANGRQWLRIEIVDNGIGFEEKYVGRIFEVFQRLHSQKRYEGSGIGLSICKKIVKLHGGIITAESSPGTDSKFIVYLPGDQQIFKKNTPPLPLGSNTHATSLDRENEPPSTSEIPLLRSETAFRGDAGSDIEHLIRLLKLTQNINSEE